jgi:hypothetical protein
MTANELRIGNYVNVTHTYFNETEIGTIQIDDLVRLVTNIPTYDYEPIPLTEEWLLRFAFTPCKYKQRYVLGKFTYNINSGWFFGNKKLINQKYVHQLQNAIFALTQKEITIKND